MLYLAEEPHGAFIERFGDSRNADGEIEIDERDLAQTCLARFTLTRVLRAITVTGTALDTIGADSRLWSAENYALCRRWSLAICSHPDQPDGILYPSRHNNETRNLALFDRASDAVEEHLLGSIRAAHNAAIEATILSTYTVNFVGVP